jgi:Zn-finger nucleic acid-binding protein
MTAIELGATKVLECSRCEGIWADKVSLDEICADRERQAAVLGMPSHLPPEPAGDVEQNIRYIPCPVCKKLMNRVNFAHCSHVIVDVCSAHGTWFDKDELRRIVEFIRAGGLEQARERELADLDQQRRALKAAQMASSWDSRPIERNESVSSLLRDLLG